MFRLAGISLLAICIISSTGCNEPLDLTKDYGLNWPSCEIHHCPMRPEHITVGGEMIYYVEYVEICQKEFPNHGGHRLNGEKEDIPYDKDVIDFVCYQCNYEHERYWKNRREQCNENNY